MVFGLPWGGRSAELFPSTKHFVNQDVKFLYNKTISVSNSFGGLGVFVLWHGSLSASSSSFLVLFAYLYPLLFRSVYKLFLSRFSSFYIFIYILRMFLDIR